MNYYSSETAAQEVVKSITDHGGRAIAVKANVRDPQQVNEMVQQVTETLGDIDTLVINANANFPIAPFVDYQWSDFEAKLLGELQGAFLPCKAVVPSMLEQQQGCIIAVSSGLSRHPGQGFIAHSTAKSGLDAFIKSLALELGSHGTRANVVSRGLTLTDATSRLPDAHKKASAQAVPLKRNGLPEDVSGGRSLWLPTDNLCFIRTNAVMEGGLSLKA